MRLFEVFHSTKRSCIFQLEKNLGPKGLPFEFLPALWEFSKKKQFLNDLKYFALFEPQAGYRTMPFPVCFRSVWGMVSFQFMVCYALEAYRQLVTQRASWGMKLRIWAMSEWNIIELVYLRLSIIRIIKKSSHQFLHCVNLLMPKLGAIFEIRLL